jgi:hypothetical protein
MPDIVPLSVPSTFLVTLVILQLLTDPLKNPAAILQLHYELTYGAINQFIAPARLIAGNARYLKVRQAHPLVCRKSQ